MGGTERAIVFISLELYVTTHVYLLFVYLFKYLICYICIYVYMYIYERLKESKETLMRDT